ncbi:Hypothetical_protein [Hexamita inflata]|uniref:Hypothetical_protein n=1 Tax=Hexamita inflata TaxID=28002 RepID=A0ABP1HMJ3_9EUKA
MFQLLQQSKRLNCLCSLFKLKHLHKSELRQTPLVTGTPTFPLQTPLQMSKRAFAHKVKWSQEEMDVIVSYYPVYGCYYQKYGAHLSRTYSQIKSCIHNIEKKSPELFHGGQRRSQERQDGLRPEQNLDVTELLDALRLLVLQ